MKTIKKDLKQQGKKIRELKNIINNDMNFNRSGVWETQLKVDGAIKKFRYEHLAYCMLRGRSYEEMERSTRDDNIIDTKKLEKTVKKMELDVAKRKKEKVA